MASTAHASLATSAAVFAGGLAVGIGSFFALSKSSFAPSSKVTRSTQQKARQQLSLPDRNVTGAGSQSKLSDSPKSDKLDARDDKGTGPAAPKANNIVKPLLADSNIDKAAKDSITGKSIYPEPSKSNRMSHIDTSMDLSVPRIVAAENAGVPIWLSGSPVNNRLSTAIGQIDKIAYDDSSAVFVYDSQTNAGFGHLCESQAAEAQSKSRTHPKVVSMQTRTGAGTAIVGYLSEKGTTSSNIGNDKSIVSALTNAEGFMAMAPSLASLASGRDGDATSQRLVLQVFAASQEREQISNDYASVLLAAATIGNDFSVVLSNGANEAVHVAKLISSAGVQGNVAHAFDGAFAGIQQSRLQAPLTHATSSGSIMEVLNAAGLENFIYEGSSSPTTLIVVPNGSHFDAARTTLRHASEEVKADLALLAVRVVRPWSVEDLLKLIPSSVQCVHVLDEVRVPGMPGVLYEDVQASILSSGSLSSPVVQPIALRAGETLSAGNWNHLLKAVASSAHLQQIDLDGVKSAGESLPAGLNLTDSAQLVTFIDSHSSSTAFSGPLFARLFRDANASVRQSIVQSRFDNFEAGGLVRCDVLVGSPDVDITHIPLSFVADNAVSQTLVIGDVAALKSYNLFNSIKERGTVIINAPGWTGAELEAKLRAEDKILLAERSARVYLLDTAKVVDKIHDATAKSLGGKHHMGNQVPKETAAAVLLSVVLDKHFRFSAALIKSVMSKTLGIAPLGLNGVSGIVDTVAYGLQMISYSTQQWKASQPVNQTEAEALARPTAWRYNGFAPLEDAESIGAEAPATRATWALPAWQSLFAEAYKTNEKALRPDLPEENYVLTVTENRRLTPLDYDRNVFHMELSTAGTGLKYEVGEALGIHGWNDAEEVSEFIKWSGYDPDEVVSVASLADPKRFESRTVYQVLQQRLDIFGKPPRSFYDVLSKLATDVDEAKWLRFVGSAEGQSTFKKLSDIETVTYADVLRMFPSARLPIDVLLTEVESIKPRHYSIASAQSFVGDSVHLLVVTVDWRTPTGSPRFGQCTRYLANLKIGEKVTVSLKPSVMKLPPHTEQPIVMSGLGTGAAPFRAYIQARAVQKKLGHPIGPMIYIFGSRYKHAEYLYGEELEAYEKDGIVKVLTAFSRDQKHKIYIQHRIEQNQNEILDLLMPDAKHADEKFQGLFTLCGPTDPLPDVQEALIKGYMAKTHRTHADGEAWLENLKEQERAVYEVY